MSNFTKTICFTLACRYDPIKSNLCSLALFLEVCSRKYFIFLIDAVGYQVFPIISLFCKSLLTTIINFNLSSHTSDCSFSLYTSMHEVNGYPFYGSSIRKFWLLIRFLISFRVAFSRVFFNSAGNLVTSEKFLGSGMKWDTSETDSTKSGNEFFNYFKTILKTFCKPLPILFAESSAPFHSLCVCLMWSHLFNLASLAWIFGCTYLPSQMYSRAYVLMNP